MVHYISCLPYLTNHAPVRGRLAARFYIKPAALITTDRLQIQVFKGFLSTFRTCVFLIIGKAVKEQASMLKSRTSYGENEHPEMS